MRIVNYTHKVNIFDFSADIYNEGIKVYFLERLREEIKFNSTKDLNEQLLKDKEKALRILLKKQSL